MDGLQQQARLRSELKKCQEKECDIQDNQFALQENNIKHFYNFLLKLLGGEMERISKPISGAHSTLRMPLFSNKKYLREADRLNIRRTPEERTQFCKIFAILCTYTHSEQLPHLEYDGCLAFADAICARYLRHARECFDKNTSDLSDGKIIVQAIEAMRKMAPEGMIKTPIATTNSKLQWNEDGMIRRAGIKISQMHYPHPIQHCLLMQNEGQDKKKKPNKYYYIWSTGLEDLQQSLSPRNTPVCEHDPAELIALFSLSVNHEDHIHPVEYYFAATCFLIHKKNYALAAKFCVLLDKYAADEKATIDLNNTQYRFLPDPLCKEDQSRDFSARSLVYFLYWKICYDQQLTTDASQYFQQVQSSVQTNWLASGEKLVSFVRTQLPAHTPAVQSSNTSPSSQYQKGHKAPPPQLF